MTKMQFRKSQQLKNSGEKLGIRTMIKFAPLGDTNSPKNHKKKKST